MRRRSLSAKERARLFLLHGGVCMFCKGKIDGTREAWDISHDDPLELGGADDDANRKPAHRKCHRAHTAKVDAPNIAKAKRRELKDIGAWLPGAGARPMPGGKRDKLKKKVSGTVVSRHRETVSRLLRDPEIAASVRTPMIPDKERW